MTTLRRITYGIRPPSSIFGMAPYFSVIQYTGIGASKQINGLIDLSSGGMIINKSTSTSGSFSVVDSGHGLATGALKTDMTTVSGPTAVTAFTNTGFTLSGSSGSENLSGVSYISYMFRKAPKFFDLVQYVGDGTSPNRIIPHNLLVTPGMIWIYSSASPTWAIYHSATGQGISTHFATSAFVTGTVSFGTSTPDSSNFYVSSTGNNMLNEVGTNYVAMLFANDTSANGVIKCGMYTGNGTSQIINCGFTNGARFVTIHVYTNSSGTKIADNWYVFDVARGITSGFDPYIMFDAADSSNGIVDAIDPTPSGFIVNTISSPDLNTTGSVYAYMAIA